MSLQFAAWIVVPVTIFLLGAGYGAVRGIIRFAQYLAHSEETQDAIVASNERISERLGDYMKETDHRLNLVERDLGIVQYALKKDNR